jgi:hypothetical protein
MFGKMVCKIAVVLGVLLLLAAFIGQLVMDQATADNQGGKSAIPVGFVGVTSVDYLGAIGVRRFSQQCALDFPGPPVARFCTSEEFIKSVNPPSIGVTAWIQPVIVAATDTHGAIDYSGTTSADPRQLSCGGWGNTSGEGLTVTGGLGGSDGAIVQRICNSFRPAACCR